MRESACLNMIYVRCCQSILDIFSHCEKSQQVCPNWDLNQGPIAPEARINTTTVPRSPKVIEIDSHSFYRKSYQTSITCDGGLIPSS